jgi:hypothetical protein
VNPSCAILPTPCPVADWGANESLALLSFVVTSLALIATAWFARQAAQQTEKLVRSELSAVLDIPSRPFGRNDETFGDGLSISASPHVHGWHVSFSGALRNIGQFAAYDVHLDPVLDGAQLEVTGPPLGTLYPLDAPDHFTFMWRLQGIAPGETIEQLVSNHFAGIVIRLTVTYVDGNGPAEPPFERCFACSWDATNGRGRSTRLPCSVATASSRQ